MGTKRVEPNWHYQGTVRHTSLGPLLVLYLLKRMNERGVFRGDYGWSLFLGSWVIPFVLSQGRVCIIRDLVFVTM